MVMINHIEWKLSSWFILENGSDTKGFKVSVPFMLVNLEEQNIAFESDIGIKFTAYNNKTLTVTSQISGIIICKFSQILIFSITKSAYPVF